VHTFVSVGETYQILRKARLDQGKIRLLGEFRRERRFTRTCFAMDENASFADALGLPNCSFSYFEVFDGRLVHGVASRHQLLADLRRYTGIFFGHFLFFSFLLVGTYLL
jgi:hypothetical protein